MNLDTPFTANNLKTHLNTVMPPITAPNASKHANINITNALEADRLSTQLLKLDLTPATRA